MIWTECESSVFGMACPRMHMARTTCPVFRTWAQPQGEGVWMGAARVLLGRQQEGHSVTAFGAGPRLGSTEPGPAAHLAREGGGVADDLAYESTQGP